MALWTGFTLHYGGQYYLFYTGRHTGEFWKQNIGLAISTDLMNFERVSEQPILPHDPELYDTTGEEQNEVGNPPTWRDPYIFKDPQSEDWIMIFSARSNPPGLYNGCIGLARSQNLIDWEIQPPLFAPGHYDELETPQILHYKGLYYLFFSTWDRCYHPDFAKIRTPTSGLHCYVSEDLYGSYRPANQTGIVLGNGENLYSVRMATFLRDRYMAIGWLNFDEKSDFIARLSHPIPMNLDSDRVIADFAP
jgi:beta-fructofuranosidase